MSHLRPIDRVSGKVKDYADYTDEEKLSALTQCEDEVQRRLSCNPPKPIDADLAKIMVKLAKGTEKAASLHPEVIKASGLKQLT